MALNARSPMTPQQERTSEELSSLVGEFLLKRKVPLEDGTRMMATMVTWLAIQDGLSSTEFGDFMKSMHEVMLTAAEISKAKRMNSRH